MKKILKKIYLILPLKKHLFFLIKSVWLPPRSIYQHLHFASAFRVNVAGVSFRIYNHNSHIENEIFWEGIDRSWEAKSLSIWIQAAAHCNTILDIGAYTGIYSLAAKSANPTGEVHTFEPTGDLYNKVLRNATLNGFTVIANQLAVSDTSGFIEVEGIYQEDKKVETVTIDSYVNDKQIEKVDLIKVDVEEHEPEVMRGMKKLLDSNSPAILIEILNDEIANEVQQVVAGKNYLYFNIDETTGPILQDNITRSRKYNFFLCTEEFAKKISPLNALLSTE